MAQVPYHCSAGAVLGAADRVGYGLAGVAASAVMDARLAGRRAAAIRQDTGAVRAARWAIEARMARREAEAGERSQVVNSEAARLRARLALRTAR